MTSVNLFQLSLHFIGIEVWQDQAVVWQLIVGWKLHSQAGEEGREEGRVRRQGSILAKEDQVGVFGDGAVVPQCLGQVAPLIHPQRRLSEK